MCYVVSADVVGRLLDVLQNANLSRLPNGVKKFSELADGLWSHSVKLHTSG